MSSIYVDQHSALNDLLNLASNEQGATLLIPDLQRPFIWDPQQVIRLVDSLIRGWPFGTFLSWKVGKDDPVRELARSFWKVVDRTDGEQAEQVSKKNPPGSFQMVLDGQQRIQSLLLAFGGDSWGFRMFDRDWHFALTEEHPRGRQGVRHWSLGCLCLDLDALASEYSKTKRMMSIDFTGILQWVVTGGTPAQSEFKKPQSYKEPLLRTNDAACKGRFVRLSRLWNGAPEGEGLEQEQAEEMARALLEEHEVGSQRVDELSRPIGSLLLNLGRVKRTRVTFLELAEFSEKFFTRESYNDAVVNIFTRLNSAGRVLTREDITFAWLKIGWNPAVTGNKGAGKCFEGLDEELQQYALNLAMEEIITGISFIWSVAHGHGRLLNNNDLLRGETIRPMAGDLSDNWNTFVGAILNVSAIVRDRDFVYEHQYQSLNSLIVLWAWCYVADRWLAAHPQKELANDAFTKGKEELLNEFVDRWLICSQWAGRWTSSTADTIAGYAKRLAECAQAVDAEDDREKVMLLLRGFLENEVKSLESDAVNGLKVLQVSRRELVRGYFTALWMWHRLDAERWKMSRIQLKSKARKKVSLEVDHAVAFALWEKKLDSGLPTGITEIEDALQIVNRLGNCSLLEKNFNISKSDRTLESFLLEVHEFKTGTEDLNTWAQSLLVPDSMLDPSTADVDSLVTAIDDRDKAIRDALNEFVKGTKARVDV
jgi:hypothetical protein